MSDLYSPLVLLLAFRGVIIPLIQTVEQLVVTCLALRDTGPEHRAPILRALRGKPDDRPRTPNTRERNSLPFTALSQTGEQAPDLGTLIGHSTNPDPSKRTPADSRDIWH